LINDNVDVGLLKFKVFVHSYAPLYLRQVTRTADTVLYYR